MVKLKLCCEDNEFLYNQFENSRKRFMKAGQDQKANNAKRIMQALEKFPLPLLSGKMAEELLQGAGPWWAGEVERWLKSKPAKRKSSPIQMQKRVEYIPEYESPEWVCMMCLSFESPLVPYDVPFIVNKFMKNLDLRQIVDPTGIFEKLFKLDLVQLDEEGMYSLTPYGISLIPRISSCPTVSKSRFEPFDAESWLDPNLQALSSQNTSSTCNSQTQHTSSLKDFQIVLIVDTAERLSMDFKTILIRLTSRELLVEKKKLWIGDYQWIIRTKIKGKIKDLSLGYVVERKTADDLAHSIIDFRYEEQKIKMKLSEAKCFYLLEGIVPKNSNKINSSTLINSILSTKFNYNFQIKITKDSTETLNWLARMTHALFDRVARMGKEEVRELRSFEDFQSLTNPNEGRTVNEVFGKQLRALDDVGEQSTLAILKMFTTPLNFYNNIKSAQQKGQRSLNQFLKSIKMPNGYSIQKKTRQLLIDLFLG